MFGIMWAHDREWAFSKRGLTFSKFMHVNTRLTGTQDLTKQERRDLMSENLATCPPKRAGWPYYCAQEAICNKSLHSIVKSKLELLALTAPLLTVFSKRLSAWDDSSREELRSCKPLVTRLKLVRNDQKNNKQVHLNVLKISHTSFKWRLICYRRWLVSSTSYLFTCALKSFKFHLKLLGRHYYQA